MQEARTKEILDIERNKKERTTMELPEDFKLLLQGLVEAAKINANSKPDEIVAAPILTDSFQMSVRHRRLD